MGPHISRRHVLAAGAAVAGSAASMAAPLGTDAAAAVTASKSGPSAKPTIVLVHGGYADSSCWNATIAQLQGWGNVNFRKVVEVPTLSHVAMLSHPQIVANLIQDAARAVS